MQPGLRANKKAHDLAMPASSIWMPKKRNTWTNVAPPTSSASRTIHISLRSPLPFFPSITNKSLMQLAEDMGMKVERRPVPEEELLTFEEAGACGTAAVISPIERIDDVENGKSYVIAKDGKPGPVCTKLYNKLRAIQYGDEPDTHGWVTVVE